MGVLTMVLPRVVPPTVAPWLVLCLLIAMVSGLVLAATAAGRRSASAFPAFEKAHGYDAFLYAVQPVPKLATLPGVASSTLAQFPTSGTPRCTCTRPINLDDFSIFEVSPSRLRQMVKLESGRMPDQSDPDQCWRRSRWRRTTACMSARSSMCRSPLLPEARRVEQRQHHTEGADSVPARGRDRSVRARVPARRRSVVRSLHHLGLRPEDQPEVGGSRRLFRPAPSRAGRASRFQTRSKTLDGLSVTNLDNDAATIERSIHPQAVGWWLLAGLAALVGLIVLGQALARQASVEGEANATLTRLGVSRSQLVLVSVVRTLIVGVVGTILGVVLAFVVSLFTLVGEVKLADPSSGFLFDSFVFLVGGLVTVITVVVLGLWPAIRSANAARPGERRPPTRPSLIVAFLVRAGAPPSALIGVRHALERGRGRQAVPVGPALVGSIPGRHGPAARRRSSEPA